MRSSKKVLTVATICFVILTISSVISNFVHLHHHGDELRDHLVTHRETQGNFKHTPDPEIELQIYSVTGSNAPQPAKLNINNTFRRTAGLSACNREAFFLQYLDHPTVDDRDTLPVIEEQINDLIKRYLQNCSEELRKKEAAESVVACNTSIVQGEGGYCWTPEFQDLIILPGMSKEEAMKRQKRIAGPHHVGYDVGLVNYFVSINKDLLHGQSVADFGAGLGQYGMAFTIVNPGTVKSWTMYDGLAGIEQASSGLIKSINLVRPQYLPQIFDWVWCLEVGEHVPHGLDPILFDNIDRHATKGAILSWGVPGQSGANHINNQKNTYAIERMQAKGFVYQKNLSTVARNLATYSWFKNTVMIFTRAQAGFPGADGGNVPQFNNLSMKLGELLKHLKFKRALGLPLQ
eukprot:m.82610 g.82610  ORF g.82610 m.82610 type:complete len:405 (-) comp25533_c1_seq5:48-1262(-)